MKIDIQDKPLLNKNVVVTRATSQSDEIISKLKFLGANPILFPTIEIKPLESEILNKSLENIANYDWLIFTSTNSVNIFLDKILKYKSIEIIQNIKIAAVGPKIVKALKKFGVNTDLVPQKYTADALADLFLETDIKQKNILIPGSKLSRHTLITNLRDKGAKVDFIAVYDTIRPQLTDIDELITEFNISHPDYITFMSPSSVNNFFEIILDNNLKPMLKDSVFVVIGPTTLESLEETIEKHYKFFNNKVLLAKEHTIEGILQIISEDCK